MGVAQPGAIGCRSSVLWRKRRRSADRRYGGDATKCVPLAAVVWKEPLEKERRFHHPFLAFTLTEMSFRLSPP